MSTSERDFQFTRSIEELIPYRSEWNRLAQLSGYPFQTYEWNLSVAQNLLADRRLLVVVLGNPGQIQAIAPLVEEADSPGRFELISGAGTFEPGDFLFQSEELPELATLLAKIKTPLHLKRIPAQSPTIKALEESYSRTGGKVLIREATSYSYIKLDEGWQNPTSHLETHVASEMRRRRRKAEAEKGPVNYQSVTPTAQNLDTLLDQAFKIEDSGWKGKEGTSILKDQERQRFIRQYAKDFMQLGILKLNFLNFSTQAVAMMIAVEYDRKCWGLKVGFDENFRNLAPGLLLHTEVFRDAATRGLNSYEFCGGIEEWTRQWTPFTRDFVSIRTYPSSVDGIKLYLRDAAKALTTRLMSNRISKKVR